MSNKLDFPATHRNGAAILAIFEQVLPAGEALEIASGSGQHVVHFANSLPNTRFTPSDPDPAHLASITAWAAENQLQNVNPPIRLDTTAPKWTNGTHIDGLPEQQQAIICINMIHIAPWEAAIGLFAGAAHRLTEGGLVYLYGPFLGAADTDAPSNLAFDADLKRRNPAWGVRDLSAVCELAKDAGFAFTRLYEMPANNFSVLFQKS